MAKLPGKHDGVCLRRVVSELLLSITFLIKVAKVCLCRRCTLALHDRYLAAGENKFGTNVVSYNIVLIH